MLNLSQVNEHCHHFKMGSLATALDLLLWFATLAPLTLLCNNCTSAS